MIRTSHSVLASPARGESSELLTSPRKHSANTIGTDPLHIPSLTPTAPATRTRYSMPSPHATPVHANISSSSNSSSNSAVTASPRRMSSPTRRRVSLSRREGDSTTVGNPVSPRRRVVRVVRRRDVVNDSPPNSKRSVVRRISPDEFEDRTCSMHSSTELGEELRIREKIAVAEKDGTRTKSVKTTTSRTSAGRLSPKKHIEQNDESRIQALRLLRMILGDKKASSITKVSVDKALKRHVDLLKIVKEQNELEAAQKKTIAKLVAEVETQKSIAKTTIEIKNVELDILTKERDQKALKLQQLSWKLAKEKTAAKEKAAIVAAATAAANSLTDRAVTAEEAVSAQQVTIQSLERMVEKTVTSLRGKDKVLRQLLMERQKSASCLVCHPTAGATLQNNDKSIERMVPDDEIKQDNNDSSDNNKNNENQRLPEEAVLSNQRLQREKEESPASSAQQENDDDASDSTPITRNDDSATYLLTDESASSRQRQRAVNKPPPPQQIESLLHFESSASSFGDSFLSFQNDPQSKSPSSSPHRETIDTKNIDPPPISPNEKSSSSSRLEHNALVAETFLSVDTILGNVEAMTCSTTTPAKNQQDNVKLMKEAMPIRRRPSEPAKHDTQETATATKFTELEEQLQATQKQLQRAKEEIALLEEERKAAEEDFEETLNERESKISQLKGVLIACNERRKAAEKKLADTGQYDEKQLAKITKKRPGELVEQLMQLEIIARQSSHSDSSNRKTGESASLAKTAEMIKLKADAEIEQLSKSLADAEAKLKESSQNLASLESDYYSASAKITELETQLVHAQQKLKNAERQSAFVEEKYKVRLEKERTDLQQAERKVEELRLEIAELRTKLSEKSQKNGKKPTKESAKLGDIIAAYPSFAGKEHPNGFIDAVDDDGLQSHTTGLEESYKKIAEIEKNFSDSISLLNRATGHSIGLLGDADKEKESDDDCEIDWLPEGYRVEKTSAAAIPGQDSFTETSNNGEDSIASARVLIETAREVSPQSPSVGEAYLMKIAKLEKKLAAKQLKLNEAELRIATLVREGGMKSLLEDAQESLRQTLREIKNLRQQLSKADADLNEADGKLMFLKNIVLSVVGDGNITTAEEAVDDLIDMEQADDEDDVLLD